ncbi:MAG: thiamine-phosphate kinase [Gemmatimonadota bacterium]|nr:thiamine-phosphate kinase [Gemmatimonadota bacterium]
MPPNRQANIPLGPGAEFDAVREMLAQWGPQAQGIGDDAAALDVPPGHLLIASTDASVEGVHFRRDWLSPTEIGGRAAAAALSDLAAMGASPIGLLLALGVPDDWREKLAELADGVGDTAAKQRCPIVGGNITRARAGDLSLTITVLGIAREPLRRSGARAGDRVWVTGRLGGPGAALRDLLASRVPSPEHLARFVAPVPRIREAHWLAQRGASAAIDISDGLLADATHVAVASRVTLSLDLDRIPCVEGVRPADAVVSGEEYELLLAIPAGAGDLAGELEKQFGVPLTEIGVVEPASDAPVKTRRGRVDPTRGHDHFS